eukprot:TRINITY_DN67878_c12_g1_i1.p1 TRINITY_DN67878_c12_g1~~TRINITY_DN67878_c12_g1_i1.p1  ORF type:complete len:119 (+),score=7.23 TRINITY_DN67878_c12_g1_i1:4-360(+)
MCSRGPAVVWTTRPHSVLFQVSEVQKHRGDETLCILVGNKNDLEVRRAVSVSEAEQWVQQNGNVPYLETSCLTGENVTKLWEMVGEGLIKAAPKQHDRKIIVIDDKPKKPARSWCTIL